MKWLFLVLLSGWLLIRFAGISLSWLDYPFTRTHSEGLLLYEALLAKRGGDPYSPITVQSFISGSNSPITYWLTAALLPATPPDLSSPGTFPSILAPGRLVSLLAALSTALLIPLLLVMEQPRQGGGRRIRAAAGLVGSVLFLSMPPTLVWSTLLGGDMPALAFTVAGLICVAWGTEVKGNRPLLTDDGRQMTEGQMPNRVPTSSNPTLLALGAVLFALAFFTRQTAIAGPLAAGAYLLARDWKVGLRWCALIALLVAVPFGILSWVTDGWFYTKLADYGVLPFRRLQFERLFTFAFWEDVWPLVLIALGYLLYKLVEMWKGWRGRASQDGSLLIPFFGLASAATLLNAGRVGAEPNQLLTAGLGVSLCVAALLSEDLAPGQRDTEESSPGWNVLRSVGTPAALALILVYAVFTSSPSSWYSSELRPRSAEEREQMRKIIYNASVNGGPLFFTDEPGIAALAGREMPYSDPVAMTALAEGGRWDETIYREMLRDGKFNMLVLHCEVAATPNTCRSGLFSPGVRDAIQEGYKVLFPDVFYTYVPK